MTEKRKQAIWKNFVHLILQIRLPVLLIALAFLLNLGKAAVELTIPEQIEDRPISTVKTGAFAYHENLRSVVVPDGTRVIGIGAFEACANLRSIVLPDSVETIGHFAFRKCQSLTSFVVPKGVETIEPDTFADCVSLKDVTLPEGLKKIDYWAFRNCHALSSIELPANLEKIGFFAFPMGVTINAPKDSSAENAVRHAGLEPGIRELHP